MRKIEALWSGDAYFGQNSRSLSKSDRSFGTIFFALSSASAGPWTPDSGISNDPEVIEGQVVALIVTLMVNSPCASGGPVNRALPTLTIGKSLSAAWAPNAPARPMRAATMMMRILLFPGLNRAKQSSASMSRTDHPKVGQKGSSCTGWRTILRDALDTP